MCQIIFYNQYPTSDSIYKWTLAPEVGRFRIGQGTDVEPDTGADKKCSAMELTYHIMFYNQLPTADTIHKWTVAPEVVRFHIGALTDVELGHWIGHQVSGHERCVKSSFIFKRHLLTPFTSGPWLQKWAGSEMVWNPDRTLGWTPSVWP